MSRKSIWELRLFGRTSIKGLGNLMIIFLLMNIKILFFPIIVRMTIDGGKML